MKSKENLGITLIISVFVCLSVAFLFFYREIWWDSAVYIGMGKYIFSLGKTGLWEESRPIVLPIIFGLGWKLGINPIYFARFISILFSVLSIWAVYLIGKKLFSKNAGLLAAFFTAFSYTFFFFSTNMLTEIPSLLFALMAFYYLADGKYFPCGIFVGISFLTRFFNIFLFLGMYLSFIIYNYDKEDLFKNIRKTISGIFIPIIPFLFLNMVLYHNPLYPFFAQIDLTLTTGWDNFEEFDFYLFKILKENFLIYAIVTISFFYKKKSELNLIFLTAFLYILIFSFAKHKEPRFLIAVLPFLYLLLAWCIGEFFSRIKWKKTFGFLMSLVFVYWLFLGFSQLKAEIGHQDENLKFFRSEIKKYDSVWITNPLFALDYNKKINGILYYSQSTLMNNSISKKGTVFFNSCDLKCPTLDIDPNCPARVSKITSQLENRNITYSKDYLDCKFRIYTIS